MRSRIDSPSPSVLPRRNSLILAISIGTSLSSCVLQYSRALLTVFLRFFFLPEQRAEVVPPLKSQAHSDHPIKGTFEELSPFVIIWCAGAVLPGRDDPVFNGIADAHMKWFDFEDSLQSIQFLIRNRQAIFLQVLLVSFQELFFSRNGNPLYEILVSHMIDHLEETTGPPIRLIHVREKTQQPLGSRFVFLHEP